MSHSLQFSGVPAAQITIDGGYTRIKIIAPIEYQSVLVKKLYDAGAIVRRSGAYSDPQMFPKCDLTRTLITAEIPVDRVDAVLERKADPSPTTKEAREAAERVKAVVGTWDPEQIANLPMAGPEIITAWQKDLLTIVNYTLFTTCTVEATQASQAELAQ